MTRLRRSPAFCGARTEISHGQPSMESRVKLHLSNSSNSSDYTKVFLLPPPYQHLGNQSLSGLRIRSEEPRGQGVKAEISRSIEANSGSIQRKRAENL